MSIEDTNKVSQYDTDIKKYAEQKKADWILNGGIEKEWDSYLDKMEKYGLSIFTNKARVVGYFPPAAGNTPAAPQIPIKKSTHWLFAKGQRWMHFDKKIPPGRLRSIKPTLTDRWVPCRRIHASSSSLHGRPMAGRSAIHRRTPSSR